MVYLNTSLKKMTAPLIGTNSLSNRNQLEIEGVCVPRYQPRHMSSYIQCCVSSHVLQFRFIFYFFPLKKGFICLLANYFRCFCFSVHYSPSHGVQKWP